MQNFPRRPSIWHRTYFERSCQLTSFIDFFLNIIPKNIDPADKQLASHFTRKRKLPFPKLIVFILSLTASGKSKGVDTKSGEFFRAARRSGLWPDACPVHRSALTRSRQKINWTIFRDIFYKAVALAYSLWPKNPAYLWQGMSVYAIDGSKYDLPATQELRNEFDPESGLNHEGRGHYPQCLVSTAYDVFRRFPVARSVVGIHGSERQEAQNLLPFIPPGGILLFDRGYPSFEFITYLKQHYKGYFIFRCPAQSTFPAVETFLRTHQQEGYILLAPSNKYIQKLSIIQREKAGGIQLRIIKLVSPDGAVSVLLTNLLNNNRFLKDQIIDLYFRRWAVEDYYREEKIVLDIEKFHGKKSNSIRQELFASVIMAVIARTLMIISSQAFSSAEEQFQFKNAIINLASEAAVLVPDDPQKAVQIFNELLREISRVKYYRPRSARPGQPRVSKRPLNKWCSDRRKKLNKS